MFKLSTLTFIAALVIASGPRDVMADDPSTTSSVAASETRTLRVEGMVSSACPVLVKRAAGGIEGVEQVTASLAKKSAQVTFDPSKTSLAEIVRIIRDRTGMDVRETPAK